MRRQGYVCALLAVLLFGATTAAAQETRGSIEGIVKDTSGAVLPGVTVEARSPALVGVATATSDTNGMFRFPALAPGVYEVTAHLAGFKTAKVENIQLALGQILKLDIPMPVASVSEEIPVTAESPIIDVKQNAATLSLPSEIIDRIPKGRNFTSVLTSAPGTNDESKAGLSIDGATGSENRYIVDGQDTTNLRTGVAAKRMLVDFLSRDWLREPLHRRRSGHDQPADRRFRQADARGLPRGSLGQVERLQRGVQGDHRRRDQRGHPIGQQRVSWRRRRVLLEPGLGGRRSPDTAPEPGQPDARRVHRHAA